MNLFIDTISKEANIILFDDNRQIVDKNKSIIKWNESSTIMPKIDELIKQNNISYIDIDNIVIVNWPGSFTWVRTSVLAANSINYIIKKNMTAISFFDMYDNYPILKSSSKRDCFFKENAESEIKIISNEDLKNLLETKNIKKIYWEIDINIFEWLELFEKIDYDSIIKKLEFDNKKQIQALYIKKPNIS